MRPKPTVGAPTADCRIDLLPPLRTRQSGSRSETADQAHMLAREAIPVDATALPSDLADRLLAHLDLAA